MIGRRFIEPYMLCYSTKNDLDFSRNVLPDSLTDLPQSVRTRAEEENDLTQIITNVWIERNGTWPARTTNQTSLGIHVWNA